MSDLWLLPAGIEELMPADALRLERLRRSLVDLCYSFGYDLVSPSLLEHLDSLLSGVGKDLELETFKLIDHSSGRQLGIRADMTPQIARIDAHVLRSNRPSRLCYAGPVLRARPQQAAELREQFQLGAELYGSPEVSADAEIVDLMISCLARCGLGPIHLDIGHVGVYRSLAELASLNKEQEVKFFEALQRKSTPDLELLVSSLDLSPELSNSLVSLANMHGPVAELADITAQLEMFGSSVSSSLENLRAVIEKVAKTCPSLDIHFDLSELRGYHYHTGVVFSAFCEGFGKEVARGGRYDSIGAVYGHSRPATGFSLDLRQLLCLSVRNPIGDSVVLAPPVGDDEALEHLVVALRGQGNRVVRKLHPGDDWDMEHVDKQLVLGNDGWIVKALSSK